MMNHDGSQQYTFGYGLAGASQIQLQQQPQQIQLQQHHFQQQHPQQILQHQGNQTIPAQNVFQLQVGGTPATALIQQNDNPAPMAQHGLISQPVIHASISVSLDNSKSLQGLNSMEAMVYPQQNNGLKIITNSGNFMQQPEIHFQSLDSMGKSNVFDGMTGAAQSNVGTAFGKQTFSGWVQRGGVGNQQYSVGQNALPSFGHLWSQFQQQKTQVNIVQQQQPINQFQSQPHQFQPHHHHHLGQPQQPPQQFTVSGIQSVNNIQMIKVQPNSIQDQAVLQPATHLIHPCAAPVQNALTGSQTSQHTTATFTTSSSLPQQAAFNQVSNCLALQMPQTTATTVTSAGPLNNVKQTWSAGPGSTSRNSLQSDAAAISKKPSKTAQRKLKPSFAPISSPSAISGISVSKESPAKFESIHSRLSADSPLTPDTVRIKPSSGKAFSESGPPKVTVTLDSLANNLSQFSEKTDSFQMMKVAEKVNKLSPRSHTKTDKNQPLLWQQAHSGSHEKKNLLTSNHLISSAGSSLDRPSSEDSNFSSPPYSFTPPNSIDSVFSPPPFTKLIPDVQLASLSNPLHSDLLLPSSSSSFKSTASSSSPSTLPTTTSSEAIFNKKPSTPLDKPQSHNDLMASLQSPTFTSSLMSASCCSIAITTTSVTSSSPRTKGDIAVAASVHSFTPLSSPGVLGSKTHWIVDNVQNTSGGHQKLIKVPYSWQRKLEDGVVVYLSPSGAVLTSLDEIRDYLLSHDTCKCGLECPFQLEEAFVFDPTINNMPWSSNINSDNLMGNLCNHRREIMAMAAFHQSQTRSRQVMADDDNVLGRKRERRKSLTSGEDLVVSPLKKLRTSITNAVNKHATLRNNTVGGNSLSSPLSEVELSWQKDDDVFYPVSTTPLSSNSALLSSSVKADSLDNMEDHRPSVSPGFSRYSKESRPKFFSENLVYSNHHPSQRLGARGHNSQNDQQSQPSRQTPSPFSHCDAPCWHPSQQNQKAEFPLLKPCKDTSTSTTGQDPKSLETKQSSNLQLLDQCKSGGLSQSKSPQKPTLNSRSDDILVRGDSNSKSYTQGTPTKYKNKASSSKAKKEKQKSQGDLTCFASKFKNSPVVPPSTSVSFMDNPTVFVAQQTAMINSSISLCNIDSPSPGPSEKFNSPPNKPFEKSVSLVSEEEEMDDNLDTSREEDDDHKANTDLESNKSFSDTTENNDSAYLSQTGSDQEKSDTVDGFGLDCLSKSSDIYDFSSSEDQLDNVMIGNGKMTQVDSKPTAVPSSKQSDARDVSERFEKSAEEDSIDKEKVTIGNNVKNCGGNKVKLKQNRTFKKKTTMQGSSAGCPLDSTSTPSSFDKSNASHSQEQNAEKFETNCFGSLNGDLSQLLASNNWNIPALQKVLVQHSAGDPERLRIAIQQVMTQITTSNDNIYSNSKKSSLGCLNSNNAQSVTTYNNGAREIKQDHLKQQSNSNSVRNVSSVGAKSSTEFLKDDTFVQKNTGKTVQMVSQSTASCNIVDSKLVTATAKGPIKQEALVKPMACTRVLQPTISNGTVGMSITSTAAPGVSSTAVAQQCCPQTSIILNTVKPQVMTMSASTMPPVSMSVVTNVSKPLTQVIPNIGINQTMLQTQQFLGTPHSRAAPQLLNHTPSQNTQIMNTLSIPGLNNSLVIANPIQQASPSSVAQLSPALAAGQIIAQGQQQPMQQMSPSFVSQTQLPKPGSISSHPGLAISNAPIPLASNPTVEVSGSIHQGALTGGTKEILNVITGTRTPTLNQSTAVANASVYSAANQPVFVIPQAKPVPPVVQLVGSSQTLAPASGLQGDMTQLLNQATISDQTQQLQNIIAASGFNPLGLQQAWNTVNLNAQQQQQQQLQLLQLQQLMLPMIQNQNQGLPSASACPSQPNTLMNAMVAQQGLQINQVVDVKTIQQSLSPAAQGFNNPALSPVAQAAFPKQIQQMASPLTVQVAPAAANPGVTTINPQVSLSNPVSILQQTTGGPVNAIKKVTAVPTVPISAVHVAHPSPSTSRIESVNNNKSIDTTTTQEASTLAQSEQQHHIISSTKSTVSNVSTAKVSTAGGKSSSKSKSKSKKSDSTKVKDPQVAKDEEHIANAVNQILAQAVQQQRELSLAAQNQPPPPPKSRNRKRDSQARARAALQAKEQELGKIASISDDAIFHHHLQPPKTISPSVHLSSSSSSSASSVTQEQRLVNTSSFAISSSQSGLRPSSVLPSHTALNTPLACGSSSSSSSSSLSPSSATSTLPSQTQGLVHHPLVSISEKPPGLHQNPGNTFSLKVDSNSIVTSINNNNSGTKGIITHLPPVSSDTSTFRKSPLNQSVSMKSPSSSSGPKKSGISLKEHLSSIVFSKDKESGKKKGNALNQEAGSNPNPKAVSAMNPQSAPETSSSTSSNSIAFVNGDHSGHKSTNHV